MRWKRREKSNPDVNEKRAVTRFLWWPTCLNDEWRWLEYAKIIQQFQKYGGFLCLTWGWVDFEWTEPE